MRAIPTLKYLWFWFQFPHLPLMYHVTPSTCIISSMSLLSSTTWQRNTPTLLGHPKDVLKETVFGPLEEKHSKSPGVTAVGQVGVTLAVMVTKCQQRAVLDIPHPPGPMCISSARQALVIWLRTLSIP